MRILTALTYYHPHWTGLTVYAKRIAEGLAAVGHDVTVLTSQHDPALPRSELIDGVRVVRVPTVGRLSRTAVMPTYPLVARQMLRTNDVVHIHSPMPEAALLVALARRAGAASVVTHQGDVVMPAGVLNGAVQRAMDTVLRSAFRRADAVVTHSATYAAASRQLAWRAPRRVEVVMPPTWVPEPDDAHVAAWRDELGLGGRRIVGFAGRFVEEKGFDVLLDAMPAVAAMVPDVAFVFAGETDVAYEGLFARCRRAWDDLVGAGVLYSVGLLRDRQRLADFYAMCDVVAVPSRSDCFAAVQIESLWAGTPLVSADIPGARDVVTMTGLGRLVAPADPDALAVAIVAELTEPRPRIERARVATWFDAERSVGKYSTLLSSTRTEMMERRALDRLLHNEADMAFRRRVPRLVEFLDLHGGERVLDGGSGMGVLSMIVGRMRDVSIVALDRDRSRLEWARREGVAAELVEADIAALPFPDGAFDAILLAEVLEHLDDDEAGLREAARVLRPGGSVAISVPHADYPLAWDPFGRLREAVGRPPRTAPGGLTGQWSGHQRLYRADQLAGVIARAGLHVDVVEELTPHAVPLNHLLVYTVGKPLIERDLLPRGLRESADRFRGDGAADRRSLLGAAIGAMRRYDRRNDHPRGDERRFVQLVARAVKPA